MPQSKGKPKRPPKAAADATRVKTSRVLPSERHKAKADKMETNAQKQYSQRTFWGDMGGKFAQVLSGHERDKQKAARAKEDSTTARVMKKMKSQQAWSPRRIGV